MEEDLTKLIGLKFGKLTVINAYIKQNGRRILCDCQCECGNKLTEYPFSLLSNGNTKSCGCMRTSKKINEKMGKPKKNIVGLRFGKLLILSENQETGVGTLKCDCGNVYELPDIRKKMYKIKQEQECPICRKKTKEKNKKYGNLEEGSKFGYFTVLRRVEDDDDGRPQYECRCQCGTKKLVPGVCLVKGQIKSCGCIKKQNFNSKKTLNGLTATKEGLALYNIWKYYLNGLKKAPNDTFKSKYNDKNIKFFPEWSAKENGFVDFYNWATLKKDPFDSQTRRYLLRFNENEDFTPNNCYFSRTRG